MKSKTTERLIVALCSLVYFASYFTRKDYAAAMVGILADGVLDKATGGLIGTALFACYGVGQIISGLLGDKIPPRVMILAGLGTTTVCNLCMPLVPSGGWMIPLWALNGFAQAMLWPPIVRLLTDYLDHESYVRASLIVTAFAHVSTILLYLYVPVCLQYFDWRTVFYSAAAVGLFSFLLFLFCMTLVLRRADPLAPPASAPAPSGPAAPAAATPLWPVLVRAGAIPVFGAIMFQGFLRDGIESWLPTLYAEAFHQTEASAVLVSVVLPIFSIVSVAAVTAVHNKGYNNEIKDSLVLFVAALTLCVPLYFLLGTEDTVGRVVCLLLAALVSGSMHALNFLLTSCYSGRFARFGRASSAAGFCNAATYVGSAISTYGIALIAENWGWQATILFWGIMAALGLVCCLIARRPYDRFYREDEAMLAARSNKN